MLRNFAKAVKGLPYYALEAGTRSGSTILGRLLDSHPNIVSTGEAMVNEDTTLEGDEVTTVVSKVAYISMQPHRQGSASWLSPEQLSLEEKGTIILTRSLVSSIYSTYKLIIKRQLLEHPNPRARNQQRAMSDDRKLLMAINGVIQSRRELVHTSENTNYVVVDYSELILDHVAACNKIYTYMGLPYYDTTLSESKISTPVRGDKKALDSEQIVQMTVTPIDFKDRVNDIINFDIDVLDSTLSIGKNE